MTTNRHLRRLKRAAALLAGVALLLPLSVPSLAAEEEPTVVRVGVYESNGFIALDEDGRMTGYGAEFMETLAEYANIRYEYVRLTWSGCMAGLLSGEIDIVTDARRSAEREELYDFSVQCIGQIQGAVFAPKDAADLFYNDYEAMDGLLVGFEQDALNKTLYEQYAALHGFEARTVVYPQTSDLREALQKGEIDAFGGDAHAYTDDLKVISIYNTDPNYIMAPKGSEIMRRINLAVERMYSENPDMVARQYTYLAQRQLYGSILLTRAEAEYIAAHPVLRVAVFGDRKPASWYDEETGSFRGIAIEMMDKLSQITGFQFEYIAADASGYASDMLVKDGVDLAMPSVSKDAYGGGTPVQITNPLYSLSVALAFTDAAKLREDEGMTVAIAKTNNGVMTMLSHKYPGMTFVRCDTAQLCIDAVRSGQADAYANAIYELEYRLKNPRNEDFHIAYAYSCPIDYCIALRSDAPAELLQILNNGIALIPQDDAEQIIRTNSTFAQYARTLSDRLYENRHVIACAILLLLSLLAAAHIYLRAQRRSLATIRRKEAEAVAAAGEAKRANAAKSDFLARMSHDMRTPLNGILGFTELAMQRDMPDEVRAALDGVQNEGKYLLGVINDTLDLGKIEDGGLTLKLRPEDVGEAVADTVALAQTRAKEKNVRCVVEVKQPVHGKVMMDRQRVQQVMVNLLSNAIKLSPEGGVVTLSGESTEPSDTVLHAKFVVTDQGAGLSPELLPTLFEPFTQERGTGARPDREGGGLSMAIAKRLVELMGGRIGVESAPGGGTAVIVYLDFPRCPEEPAPQPAADPAEAIRGAHILLCEDNAINTIVAKGYLAKAGCTAEYAANGQEGAALFAASEPGAFDLVLMDIRMPVMDGVEATKAIRAMDRADAATIPIIALTANVFEEDIRAYLAAGMNAHLAKPIEYQTLVQEIARCMPNRQAAGR